MQGGHSHPLGSFVPGCIALFPGSGNEASIIEFHNTCTVAICTLGLSNVALINGVMVKHKSCNHLCTYNLFFIHSFR